MTVPMRNDLKELYKFKVKGYNYGKESKYLKNIPSDFSFGYIAEISVAAILGYLCTYFNKINVSFRVTMSVKLDKLGIDFIINSRNIQLKSKYSYENNIEYDMEKDLFVVHYNGSISPFIRSLMDYLELDFGLITNKCMNHIQMIWINYMSYYGILESMKVRGKSKRNKKRYGKKYIDHQVISIKQHAESNGQKKEGANMLNNTKIKSAYEVYKRTTKFPRGFWDDITKNEFIDLIKYAIEVNNIILTQPLDVTALLLNKLGFQYGFAKVFGTCAIKPIRDALFGENTIDISTDNSDEKTTQPTDIKSSEIQELTNNKLQYDNKSNDTEISDLEYLNNVIKILRTSMSAIVKHRFGISNDEWMAMPLQDVFVVSEKVNQLIELEHVAEETNQKINNIMSQVKVLLKK